MTVCTDHAAIVSELVAGGTNWGVADHQGKEPLMNMARNQFGVPQYPLDDARHLLVLLAAIDLLGRPTVSALADFTGLNRDRIDLDAIKLREQFGVVLHKVGEIYHLESWGDVLKKEGVQRIVGLTRSSKD